MTINGQDITMRVDAPSGVLQPVIFNYTLVAESGAYGMQGASALTTIQQSGLTDRSLLFMSYDCENAPGHNVEVQTSGVDLQGLSSFQTATADTLDYSYFDNTTSHTGTYSIRNDCLPSFGGDSSGVTPTDPLHYAKQTSYGFKFQFTDAGKGNIVIDEGDEIWYTYAQKLNAGFSMYIQAGGGDIIKWAALEPATQAPDSSRPRQYISPGAYYSGSQTGAFLRDHRFTAEGYSGERIGELTEGYLGNGDGLIERDVWTQWEMYVKVSTNENVGLIRMWKDGVLVAEYNRRTKPHDGFNHWRVGKYWNAGIPSGNTIWFDNIAVAVKASGSIQGIARDDTPHLSTDAQGNLFIGPPAAPASDFNPVLHHHFDNGTLGDTADGSDGYGTVVKKNDSPPNQIVYSNTWSKFGAQSAKHFHPQGFVPPFQFQGETSFPTITDEIWFRCYVLLEAGYVVDNTGGKSKFMRLNCRNNGVNTNNAWSLGIGGKFASTTGGYGFSLVCSVDGTPQNFFESDVCAWDGDTPGQYPCRNWGAFGQYDDRNVAREQWYNCELNIKFATDTTGYGRMFIDKKLLFDTGPMQTINQAGDGAWEIEIFSTPQPGEWDHDQYAYVDGIVVTDGSNPPPNLSEDAFRYPIIGDWTE